MLFLKQEMNNYAKKDKIVYYDTITGIFTSSDDGPILPRVPKHKSKSLKCGNCTWSTHFARKHPNVMHTMKRLYIKTKHEWKAIGWYCTECGSVVLDELVIKYRLFPIPPPKITILRTRCT